MNSNSVRMEILPYWTSERTRQVIASVCNNIGLYAKSSRVYKDKQAKDLAWQCIGASLIPPCSGDMVAKRFKHLRDTFQKERKKVSASIPSSGTGVQDGDGRFESTWEYYNDLLFLSDHINSRIYTSVIGKYTHIFFNLHRTTSNYTGHSSCDFTYFDTESNNSQFYIQPDDRQFYTDEADSCTNVLKRKAEMTQENETMEDIVYVDNILPVSMQCISSDENKSLLNKKSNMTSCATPSISTSSVPIIKVQAPKKMSTSQSEASLPEKSFTIRGKAVASIQNQQYKIPISDMMKREKNKDVIESCIEQLSKSASDIAARITRPTETITNTNIEELNFLQYLIKQIPDNKKLLCISDFFRVAEIYRKGASPSIKET